MRKIYSLILSVSFCVSLLINGALLVSESFFNLGYRFISSVISVFQEGYELKNSVVSRNATLSSKIDELSSENTRLSGQVAELDANNRQLSEYASRIEARNLDIETRNINITRQLDEISVENRRLLGETLDLSGNNRILASKVSEFESAISVTARSLRSRISRRVSRNLAAFPAEQLPGWDIPLSIGLILLELRDACLSFDEVHNLEVRFGLSQSEDRPSFCSIDKENLMQMISAAPSDEAQCMTDALREDPDDFSQALNCITRDQLLSPDSPPISTPIRDDL